MCLLRGGERTEKKVQSVIGRKRNEAVSGPETLQADPQGQDIFKSLK